MIAKAHRPAAYVRCLVIVASTAASVFASHPARAVSDRHHGSIAFSSYRGEQVDVYTMRPDGTHVRDLTDDGHPDFQPAWSPDGSTIAFVSLHAGRSDFDQIYAMDARGRNRVRLTDVRRGNPQEPAWSPDGARIAFHVVYGGAIDDELFVMDADGSDRMQLTHNQRADSDVAWSPDASQLAFVQDGRVVLIDPDGGAARPVTPDGMLGFDPAWSPDGQWIAFVGRPSTGRDYDLYVIRPDGSDMRRLRTSVQTESDPSWSPNGRRVVYALTRYHYENDYTDDIICTVRIDGTHRIVLSSDNQTRDSAPDWRR